MGFSLILLPEMFILYHSIIYFFLKSFFFSNVYISVNTMYECSYLSFGWEIGHPLRMYVTRGMEAVIQNVCRCVQGERSITLHVYVRTYTISFHVFVLWCLMETSRCFSTFIFTWVLCIYIILDKGCHILYIFGLTSTVCSHVAGVHLI